MGVPVMAGTLLALELQVPATAILQQADSLPCILNRQTDRQNPGWHHPWGTENLWGTSVNVPHGDTATKTLQETLIQSRSPWGRDGEDGAVLSSAASEPCQHRAQLVLSMLKTSPSCSCTQLPAGRPRGVEGGQGSRARLLSRQICWICGNCCGAGAGESALSHPTSTLPGVGLRRGRARLHHPHPACSPSSSSPCCSSSCVGCRVHLPHK